MKFCMSCGTELPTEARFCGSCGASVAPFENPTLVTPAYDAVPPPPAPSGAPQFIAPSDPPPPVYEAPQISHGFEDIEPPASNMKVIIGGILAAFALLGVLYYFIFVRDDIASSEGGTPTAQVKPIEVAEASKQLYAVTQANIRDQATATGSNIIGKLPRGTAASGKLILGVDGTSDWLKLDDDKGFVGAVNLSETVPPTLTKMLNDKVWTAIKPIEIYAKPEAGSAVLDRVSIGAKLTLVGLTANDFIEIKLGRGGVGYLANGAEVMAAAAAVTSKPIAISFNPNTCNYGGEIESLFAQLGKQMQSKRAAIENGKYPDDDAREAALNAFDSKGEGQSNYLKLQRSYNGLTVTGIGQHYESQSLYFSEPAAKVIETLRSQGIKFGKDGQIPSSDLYAGVDVTSKYDASYGRSSLNCGV